MDRTTVTCPRIVFLFHLFFSFLLSQLDGGGRIASQGEEKEEKVTSVCFRAFFFFSKKVKMMFISESCEHRTGENHGVFDETDKVKNARIKASENVYHEFVPAR